MQAVLPPVQPSPITKPSPEPIGVVQPVIQPMQSRSEPTPVIKSAHSSGATTLCTPVAALLKLSLTLKCAEAVRPPVQPTQSRPEPQKQQVLAAPVVTKLALFSTAPAPSAPVAAPRKLSLTSKHHPQLFWLLGPVYGRVCMPLHHPRYTTGPPWRTSRFSSMLNSSLLSTFFYSPLVALL